MIDVSDSERGFEGACDRPYDTVMRQSRWVAVSFLLLWLGTVGAAARPQAHFRASTDVALFQVVVKDSAGAFVEDLTAEDFTILVGGEPRPAALAYAVNAARGTLEAGGETSGAADALPTAAIARRRFLLLFDFVFTTRRGVREARKAALEFTPTLHKSD